MIYIDFFGGTHGHFLEYSINALDDTVKNIDPFTKFGTSHAYYKKILAKCNHFSFYNTSIDYKNNHVISIRATPEDCLLVNLLSFARAGDYGFDLYNLEKELSAKVKGTSFFSGLRESLLHYGIDILKNQPVSRGILRESLKYNFADSNNNSLMQVIQNQHYTAVSKNVWLRDFYNVSQYIAMIESIVKDFELLYNVDRTWYANLWQRFIDKNSTIGDEQNVINILHSVIDKVDCVVHLNLIQEAWLNAMLEKEFGKEMPFHMEEYFTSTAEINQYLGRT